MSAGAGRPPSLSPKSVVKLVNSYFSVRNVIEDSIKSLPSYNDVNYYFRGEHPDNRCTEFVLKLINRVYTPFPVLVGLNKMMNHISSSGFKFATPRPLFSNEGTDILSLTAEQISPSEDAASPSNVIASNEKFHICLFPYIPGKVLAALDKEYVTPTVLRSVGETLATIDKELKVMR
jgi:Ser/Thr protein kinase RdoA (MazF antagonist)